MILKHRDIAVLRFEWVEPEGVRIVSVNEAATRFLPLDLHGEATDEGLWRWLRHRIVPKHRNYIQEMLLKLGISYGVKSIIEVSKGLSLNDVHWVCDNASKARWRTVNLYENPFSKAMAVLAFTGNGKNGLKAKTPPETSPEFSTNGMLAKCWRRTDEGIVLYKSGSEHFANAGFEPYSEYYAAQIAEALGYAHVSYGLEKFKGRLCSTCPLFTSEKVGFIPAGRLLSTAEALADPRFAEIFFFDALIFNTDRHLGNFGYLIDNDTNEIVGAAPIFDNGYGLFSLALDRPRDVRNHEWDDLRKYARKIGPSLYLPWLAFPGGVTPAMKAAAMKLKGFRFKRHPVYNLSTSRLQKLEDFLQNRASKIVEFGEEADSFLEISEKNGAYGAVNEEQDGAYPVEQGILQNVEADPYISQEELAQLMGVSRRTIQRKISDLKRSGQLVRKGAGQVKCWKVNHENR